MKILIINIMKKRWFILGIICIIIFFILVRFIYFSSTEIKVIDENNKPLKGAHVDIGYSCEQLVLDFNGGRHYKGFGSREKLTNINGIAEFNSLNKFFVFSFPVLLSCKKAISVSKEGYCDPKDPYIEAPINSLGKRSEPCWIQFAGTSETNIAPLKKQVQLKLQRSGDYDSYLLKYENVSCKIFKDICLEFPEFNSLLSTGDVLTCNKDFISKTNEQELNEICEQQLSQMSLSECINFYKSSEEYKYSFWTKLNYECYTELALVNKDPKICEGILFTNRGNGLTNPIFSETPKQDIREFKMRCFKLLALELKDPSICEEIEEGETDPRSISKIEYCKFDAIKMSGDISKCSLLDNPGLHDFCEVYLS